MFFKKILPHNTFAFLFYSLLFYSLLFFKTNHSFSFNRWFKFNPGIKIAASIVDMSFRIPENKNDLKFGFALGPKFQFQFEKFVGLDLEILYSQKGSSLRKPGNDIILHYISVPMLLKFWLIRQKLAFSFGPVHHFLLSGSGKLLEPNIPLTTDSFAPYDLALSIGLQYVFVQFPNGMQLVSDFRFEIGLINVYRQFRPEIFNRTYPQFGIGINF